MNKLVCIYPIDPTTNFLMPIYKQLQSYSNFTGYRIDTTKEEARNALFADIQNITESHIVFFLGHGASNKLYGSPYKDEKKQELFNKKNISNLTQSNFICFACRSKEFAQGVFQNYIGFGNIISDFSEVTAERDLGDFNYLDWAKENDIQLFRGKIVEAFVKSIDYTRCASLSNMYRMFRLFINCEIANLLVEKKINNYRGIADMLYDFLSESKIEYETHF